MKINLLDNEGRIRALADIELEVIDAAILKCNGNIAHAARALGIGRSTLYRKIDRSRKP